MFRWYVIQSKPGQLLKAQQELEAQEFETYLPLIEQEKIRKGKRVKVEEPLFPGYLFIYLSEASSNWRPIRSTRGVAKMISFGQQPAVVPDSVITQIRTELRGIAEPQGALCKDQALKITEGPFKNLRALFQQYDGEQRAYVLLELLGKWQRMSLELSSIEPLS